MKNKLEKSGKRGVKMLSDREKIVKSYILTASLYGKLMENGDYENANINLEKNEAAFQQLLKCNNNGNTLLLKLLYHNNPHVRISAATHLIKTHSNQSIAVLKELSHDDGFHGLTARMVLEEYKCLQSIAQESKTTRKENKKINEN